MTYSFVCEKGVGINTSSFPSPTLLLLFLPSGGCQHQSVSAHTGKSHLTALRKVHGKEEEGVYPLSRFYTHMVREGEVSEGGGERKGGGGERGRGGKGEERGRGERGERGEEGWEEGRKLSLYKISHSHF